MILICYGIPKSASSFIYQLSRHAIESLKYQGLGNIADVRKILSGNEASEAFAELVIKEELHIEYPSSQISRETHLDHLIDRLLDKLRGQKDIHVVLKTHLPCTKKIAAEIELGTIFASATYRHPAEMVLSRRDMALRDNEKIDDGDIQLGYRGFINEFYTWANLASVRKYYYDDIALYPNVIAQDVYNHIGSTADPALQVSNLLSNKEQAILEYNKGELNRAAREMALERIHEVEEFFSDFMAYINENRRLNI